MSESGGPAAQTTAPGPLLFHGALIAPALLFFAPHLFFGQALFARDTGLYFYPHRALVSRALLHGRLPQWSPAEYAGVELLGDANLSVFHPLPLLAGLFPLPWGYQLYACAAMLLAAWGAARLAREVGCSRGAQLVAGFSFAASGPFLSLIESGQFLVLATAPWLCATAVRCAGSRGAAGLAPLALAAALTVLAGTPEIGFCAFALAFALAATKDPAGAARVAAAFGLGLALAAVQIVPTLAFLPVSARADGFAPAQVLASSLALVRLPELLVPFFSGAPDAEGLRSWALGPSQVPWTDCVHLGAAALALAALARGRMARASLLAAAALVMLSLGGETAPTGWLWSHLPGLRWIRFPDKLVGVVPLAVALAAALGWDALAAGAVHRRRWAVLAGASALAASLAPWLSLRYLQPRLAARAWASFADTALWTLPAELWLLAVAAASLALGARLSPRRRAAAWAVLLAVDLGAPALRMDLFVPKDELVRPPAVAAALGAELGSRASLFRVDARPSGVTPEQGDALGEPGWPRPRRLFWLRREGLEAAGPAIGELRLMRGYSGLMPGTVKRLYAAGGRGVLDALSVRYGLDVGGPAPSPFAAAGFAPAGSFDGGWVRLWRNERAAPRVRLAVGALPLDPHAPVPPCAAVSLAASDLAQLPATLRAAGCAGLATAAGRATLAREEPERIELSVDAAAEALVVLGDALVDGWTVEVDGRPASALAAYGALRAVAVGPGAHAVVWKYRTPGLVAGAWLSFLALVACAALGLRARATRRHS